MNVPATGRAWAVGGAYTSMLSSDWLVCLPRNNFTTSAPCFAFDRGDSSAEQAVNSSQCPCVGPTCFRLTAGSVFLSDRSDIMAKRRAEDTLLHDSPSKRCYRSLCCVDLQLESESPSGGVSPPSLLALLGSRCRKRPYYFEDPEKQEEAALFRTTTNCDTRRLHAGVLTVQTSGNFPERRSCSAGTKTKKRLREYSQGPETVANKDNDTFDGDTNTDDCTYNSFQYWRVPLPELDLSLLEDTGDHSQSKEKLQTKDSSSDAMET